MKRHLVILAALAALALPALVNAQEEKVGSTDATAASTEVERRSVDASELTSLLVQKGMITPQEQNNLTRPMDPPTVDEKALQDFFRTDPYRGE